MKYLMLGAMTQAGQQMQGPDLEAWMAEIGAWYEKQGSTGKIADPGHQLDWPHKARTVRAELLTALGRDEQARAANERALALAANPAERELLARRLSL